jgi:ABC-type phosphate/phosphonate transport system ATPase subunit
MMCVPRDQRKSGDDQFEQLEVNKPQHQRRADISGGQIKRSLLFTADVEP